MAQIGQAKLYKIMRCNGLIMFVGGLVIAFCTGKPGAWVIGGLLAVPGAVSFLTARRFTGRERKHSPNGTREDSGSKQ